MSAERGGIYGRYVKRLLDILCAAAAMLVFCWLYAVIALLVRVKLGRPVIFRQERPGRIDPKTGRERIFRLYKFRSMTDERGADGELLPDGERLTPFGRFLRATSLDELPEAWNILRGDMSVVGPRPQLVRDMVFMTPEQRMRHTVRPGLSGLAQVNGRNDISWQTRLDWDLRYIESITFSGDCAIVLKTVRQTLCPPNDIVSRTDITPDYGDELLMTGRVTRREYDEKQAEARALLVSCHDHP